MRRRALSEADRRVWAGFVHDIVRLPGIDAPAVAPPAPSAETRHPAAPLPPRARTVQVTPIEIGTSPGGIDRSTWSRFRSGKLVPQSTLDLHGRTVQRAHDDLHAFIAHALGERLRCVEIITGRGSGESGGVLRREVPHWLNGPAIRPAVLAASHPHPANQGAIRVLLRRVR